MIELVKDRKVEAIFIQAEHLYQRKSKQSIVL